MIRTALRGAAHAAGAGLLLAAWPVLAQATDYGVRVAVAGVSERLSESQDGQPAELREADGGYLDIKPWLHTEFSPAWSMYLRAQGFVADRVVSSSPDEGSEPVEHFFALREWWLDYRGFTDYPDEALRLGRQRLREDLMSTLWWDQDAEAVRWFLDTTLLRVSVGAAEQLATFRSDVHELSAEQEGRSYVFGSAFREWLPGHEVGGRLVYVQDRESLPAEGEPLDSLSHVEKLRSMYLSLRAARGSSRDSGEAAWVYWAEATWLGGEREQVVESPQGTVAATEALDVSAMAFDAGLRLRVLRQQPLLFGGAFASGSGGHDGDDSEQYRQTGLHSNRSRHAGIRTPIHRFNEVLRADLSNLQAYSLFAAYAGARFEAALVYGRFLRHSADDPIVSEGLDLGPLSTDSGERDIGAGWDAVAAYYFQPPAPGGWADDLETSIRLRASMFEPGDAVVAPADDNFYRLMLEWVVRL